MRVIVVALPLGQEARALVREDVLDLWVRVQPPPQPSIFRDHPPRIPPPVYRRAVPSCYTRSVGCGVELPLWVLTADERPGL